MRWKPRPGRFAWWPVLCRECKQKVWLERCMPAPGYLPHPDWQVCCPCYTVGLLRAEAKPSIPETFTGQVAAIDQRLAEIALGNSSWSGGNSVQDKPT